MQKHRDSYEVLYAEHQRVLHELNDLKSEKTYTDLKAQVAAAEKRAQEAEAKAAKEASLRKAAERRADAAFKKGYDEGTEQAAADRKEMYAVLNQNKADYDALMARCTALLDKSEQENKDHKEMAKLMQELKAKYESLWQLHFKKPIPGAEIPVASETGTVTDKITPEDSAYTEQLRQDNYRLMQELVQEKGKNENLEAQLKANFSNSNIPSTGKMRFGPVQAKRPPTGKKQGGQPGHPGHRRKVLKTDQETVVDVPDDIKNNPDWVLEGYRVKQKIGIKVIAVPVNVKFPVYRNVKTGELYHPPIPDELHNEVNYDESLKAVIFLMKNVLNTSERKISDFLKAVSGGQLSVSRSFINGLNEEFANKTEEEWDEIYDRLASGLVMNTDMTTMFVNGELTQITINTNGSDYLFQVHEHKGFEGQKGTPLEHFLGALISDGDPTYTHFGTKHQRCIAHIVRPFGLIEEFEPYLTWHSQFENLMTQALKERRESKDHKFSPQRIEEIEREYDRVMQIAEAEYKKYPPLENGFTLGEAHFKDLRKNKDSILLFIHDPTISPTNVLAELGARWLKRYQANAGTFRGKTGTASVEDFCASQSILVSLKNKVGYSEELLEGIEKRFTNARTISKKAHLKARREAYAKGEAERAKIAAEKAEKKRLADEKKAEKVAHEAEQRRVAAEERGKALAAKEQAKAAAASRG